MASEAGGIVTDGSVGYVQDTACLTEGGAFGDERANSGEESWVPEPVGCGEGLGSELTIAVQALIDLQGTFVRGGAVESIANEAPLRIGSMEGAVWVWTVGWLKAAATPDGMSTKIAHTEVK